jgi:hypothetical protein
VSVGEGLSKLTMKEFAIIVIPLVHRTRSSFQGRWGGFGVMGVGMKSSFPNGG